MMEKSKVDPSDRAIFTKEKQYKYIRYLRALAYSVASHYKGDEDRLRRASLRGLADAVRLFKIERARKKDYNFPIYATWFMKESVEKEIGFKDKKADT